MKLLVSPEHAPLILSRHLSYTPIRSKALDSLNNINQKGSTKIKRKLSKILPYDAKQQETLKQIRESNSKFGSLNNYFKDLGYLTIDDHKLTDIDLKRVRNDLISLEQPHNKQIIDFQQEQQLLVSKENQSFHRAKKQSDQQSFPTRSKAQSYHMSTLYDFIHHIKSQIGFFQKKENALQFKERFHYLENSIYAPNTLNNKGEPIKFLSFDFKSKNNELREIGLSIYTPPKHTDLSILDGSTDDLHLPNFNEQITRKYLSAPPDIKTYHIIIDEYFGILSQNHYKEGQSLKLSLNKAIKFLRFTLESHLSLDFNSELINNKPGIEIARNKLVGYNIGNVLKMLSQLDVTIPNNPDQILDIMNLYMTPFLYQDSPVSSEASQHDDYLRILPFFMKFESILDRLELNNPHHAELDLTNPATKSRFELLILHKLVNPYVRLDLQLDDFQENWSFMKRYLDQQISCILRKNTSISDQSLAEKMANDRADAILKSIAKTNKLIEQLESKTEARATPL